jgi:hypothetical protein
VSISGVSLLFPLKLSFQLRSLRDRILIAGYDDADIKFVGMRHIPGSNVDKALTDNGALCDASLGHTLTLFHSLETYQDKG